MGLEESVQVASREVRDMILNGNIQPDLLCKKLKEVQAGLHLLKIKNGNTTK